MFCSVFLVWSVMASAELPGAPAEPMHKGRPLSAWLADLNRDANAHREALLAISAMGPAAATAAAAQIMAELEPPNQERQKPLLDTDAARMLEAIGPPAKEAIPALLARMKRKHSGEYCLAAADAILAIDGPQLEATRALVVEYNPSCGGASLFVSKMAKSHPSETVRHLIKLTRDENASVREHTLDILASQAARLADGAVQPADLFKAAGDATREVPAALEKALSDKDPHVKVAAVRAYLQWSSARAEAIVPAVVAALAEDGFRSRYKKGAQIGEEPARLLLPVADKAFEPLLPLLDKAAPPNREHVIWVLARLPLQAQMEAALKGEQSPLRRAGLAEALGHSNFPTAVPALTGALKDTNAEVRFRAAVALVELTRGGKEAAAAVPALIARLDPDEPQALGTALHSLQALKTLGEPATDRLKELARHSNLNMRVEAALALAAVNPSEPAAVPVLVEALGPDYRQFRGAIYRALGNLGPLAKPALPGLARELDNTYGDLAASAIFRIEPLGPTAKKAIIALTRKAGRFDEPVFELKRLPNQGRAAIPILLELMSDPKSASPGAAVALFLLDPTSSDRVLKWLREQLTSGNDETKLAVVHQVWQLEDRCKDLSPELVKLLQSTSEDLRNAVVDILPVMGPPARDALPTLRALAANDPSIKVKRSAASAIRRIEKQ